MVDAGSEPLNHNVSGLHKSGNGVAFAEAEFAGSICGDDGGDLLVRDGQHYLRKQAFDADADDLTRELIATADTPKALTRFEVWARGIPVEEWLEGGLGDAVMTAGGGAGA